MNNRERIRRKSVNRKKRGRRRINPGRLLIVVVFLFVCLLGSLFVLKKTLDTINQANVVVLDASFGGDLTGNTGLMNESEYAEKVVEKLEKILKTDKRFKVILTKKTGESMSVANRVKKINKSKASLVLNIRANASEDSNKKGMALYANDPSSKANKSSLLFANAIAEEFQIDGVKPSVSYYYYTLLPNETFGIHIVDQSDTTDYGEDTLSLMEGTSVPTVASEAIYVTSNDDVSRWASEEGYLDSAKRYYRAICKYFGVTPNE